MNTTDSVVGTDLDGLKKVALGLREKLLQRARRHCQIRPLHKRDPEDLVQDALLLMTREDQLRHLEGMVMPRIQARAYRILRFAYLKSLRAEDNEHKALQGYGLEKGELTAPDPSSTLESQELVARLLQQLDELDESDRELLTRRYINNLPHRDIAAAMGKTEGACRSKLHRLLQKLLVRFGGHEIVD